MSKIDSKPLSPDEEIIAKTGSRPRLRLVIDKDTEALTVPETDFRHPLVRLICGMRDGVLKLFGRKSEDHTKSGQANASADQNTAEVDPNLLSETRDYFASHFLVSREDVPLSLLKIVVSMKDASGHIPHDAFNSLFLIEANGDSIKLLNKAIDNYLRDKVKNEKPHLEPEKLLNDKKKRQFVVQSVLNEIKGRYHEEINLKDIFDRIRVLDEALDDADKKYNIKSYPNVIKSRKNAVKNIDANFNTQNWLENPLALDDKEMSQFFSEKKKEAEHYSFLTTYFDSALEALTVTILDNIIKRFVKKEFKNLIRFSKENILKALEPRNWKSRFTRRIDDHSPISANLFFTKNGTSAAELFIDHFIHEGDSILMGKQEYVPIKKYLRSKKAEVIDELPIYTGDDEAYVSQVEDLVVNRGINFILISDISRLGTQVPLKLFKDIRKRHPELKLVVDACQTIGRKVVDYDDDEVNPNVIIASCQKGFETLAESTGFLVLTDTMFETCHNIPDFLNKAKEIERGTEHRNLPVDARIACAPEQELKMYLNEPEIIKIISKEILEKICSSVEKRGRALKDLSSKFAQLVQEINRRHGNRIKILNPEQANIYKPGEKINEKSLSGIFECKIKGVTLDQVMGIAKTFGITIGDHRETELKDKMEELKKQDKTPDEKKKLQDEIDEIMANHEGGISEFDTFRIAFHPYMGNEAIKILGYVLHECCRRYPMHN